MPPTVILHVNRKKTTTVVAIDNPNATRKRLKDRKQEVNVWAKYTHFLYWRHMCGHFQINSYKN